MITMTKLFPSWEVVYFKRIVQKQFPEFVIILKRIFDIYYQVKARPLNLKAIALNNLEPIHVFEVLLIESDKDYI